jgi:inhibitor of KinA sporulation pathway (predicted exonuclease)
MIRYSLDLELEQPYTNPQTPDSKLKMQQIIQIGVVFFNSITSEVLHKQKWYINIEVPLSSFIKTLTDITDEQLQNGTTTKQAYNELLDLIEKYEARRRPVTWGSGDLQALQSEVDDYRLGRSESNVKALWQDVAPLLGINGRGGLGRSMDKMGLKFKGRAHDALNDAENTMYVYLELLKRFK